MADDDDEFGDLYADVLRPAPAPPPPSLDSITAASTPSTTSKPSPPPVIPNYGSEDNDDGSGDQVLFGAPASGSPSSGPPSQLPAQSAVEGGDEDWILGQKPAPEEQPSDWSGGEGEGFSSSQAADLRPQSGVVRVLLGEEEEGGTGLVEAPDKEVGEEEGGTGVGDDVEASLTGREGVVALDVGSGTSYLSQEPVIPGLSVSSILSGALHGAESGDAKISRSDDWDSDSEDDLQIVLNDDNLGTASGNRDVGVGVEDDDDEEVEDDLVIVTDEDQHGLHHRQGMDGQELDEESSQQPLDGERKEKLDVAKGNGEIVNVAPARMRFNNHVYHGQHHSQFKYIRSSAVGMPAGAGAGTGAASGQGCSPLTMGPMAGRGRGAQRSFHSGYGLLIWSNGTSTRAYGGGLEFTLPSHKTIFDINLDDFAEKPWRLPGVDISDFFNFELNEDKWRDFCKQLEQLRLEATMQSKIRVYESGRSGQDYDPDLPPELAAATGLHGTSSESTRHGKADGEQIDLIGQGRGAPCSRPQMPIGRAIQVESSFGERLPSIDTRPSRMRDSDAVIEIILQDSFAVCSAALDQELYEPRRQDVEGDHEDEDDDRHTDSEYFDDFPPGCSGRKRVVMKRKGSPTGSVDNDAPEGSGILPFSPDASSKDLPNSKSPSPMVPGDHYSASLAARQKESSASGGCSNDGTINRSVKLQTYDGQKEKSGDSMENEGILQNSPIVPLETAVEVKLEQRSDEHNDGLALDDGSEVEKEETAPDLLLSGEYHGDNGSYHAIKKQKLSSLVEQLVFRDNDDGYDSRATQSDNSRAKSGSSKDYLKRREGSEEVVQSGQTRQIGDLEGHYHKEERSFKQRDGYGHDGGRDMSRSHVTSKGREDTYLSRPHREHDSTNYGRKSESFERGKERDDSLGGCLRREDDAHGRRQKYEDRKQDHDDEIGLRQRSKVRVNERKGKNEDLHSAKHIGDGDWRGRPDRDGVRRQSDRGDILMSRHENFDDLHVKRRKDEEQARRDKVAKEDAPHVRKGMDGTTHSKRERDNGASHKSREDQASVRDKVENHFTKHRDDNLRHGERGGRRLNRLNEDTHTHKKREEGHKRREEGHIIVKSGRVLEDKRVGGIERVTNVSKGLSSDGHPPKDRKHPSEHKRGNHSEEHTHAQHKAQQKVRPHDNQLSNKEKNSRNERFSSHGNRSSAASDSQQLCMERHRENSRKSKESKGGEPNCPTTGKRKYDDQICHLNEKVGAKGANEQEGSNTSSGLLSKKGQYLTSKAPEGPEQRHFRGNHAEEDVASDDDSNENVRKGRSKLERWTSHQERDYSNSSPQPLPSLSRARDSGISNVDIVQLGDSIKTVGNNVDSNAKEAEVMQTDHMAEDGDRHPDTVAKLKQQNERFILAMPGEDNTAITKNPENETPPIESAAIEDAEIKQDRPARKRRWINT